MCVCACVRASKWYRKSEHPVTLFVTFNNEKCCMDGCVCMYVCMCVCVCMYSYLWVCACMYKPCNKPWLQLKLFVFKNYRKTGRALLRNQCCCDTAENDYENSVGNQSNIINLNPPILHHYQKFTTNSINPIPFSIPKRFCSSFLSLNFQFLQSYHVTLHLYITTKGNIPCIELSLASVVRYSHKLPCNVHSTHWTMRHNANEA